MLNVGTFGFKKKPKTYLFQRYLVLFLALPMPCKSYVLNENFKEYLDIKQHWTGWDKYYSKRVIQNGGGRQNILFNKVT